MVQLKTFRENDRRHLVVIARCSLRHSVAVQRAYDAPPTVQFCVLVQCAQTPHGASPGTLLLGMSV